MLKSLIFALILTCGAYAQQHNSTVKDTLSGENVYKMPLSTLFRYAPSESRFYAYDTTIYNPGPIIHINSDYPWQDAKQNMPLYKTRLLEAMNKIPKFKKPGDLGVVSQILGYTGAAAAGYLLYEHIRKYKDEY